MSIALVYMFLILSSTVLARIGVEKTGNDWVPLRILRVNQWWTQTDLIEQILANIVMFIPLGYLLTISYGRWSILCGLLFSLIVEISQLLLHCGFSEIDDVIHNTIGAGIGTEVYYCVQRIKAKKLN